MSNLSRSIAVILQGAGKAFRAFPATMACAVGFAIVTMIRVQLDWPDQEPYHFLFTCLHWGFAAGAAAGLALVVWAQSRGRMPALVPGANLGGALVAVGTFLALYLPGGMREEGARFARLSQLATSRMIVLVAVSLLLFILLAGHPPERSGFARSFFMCHKALVVALVYGGALMAGTSGVARAVQALLYRNMSEKVYGYLGTLVGFLAFAIFVGYFPDFRWQHAQEDAVVARRDIVQKQPRFIEMLLGAILIPIMLAMTAVLLLWAARILITGDWPVFAQLSGIAATYSLGGLWLHMLTSHHETALARLYRWFYPGAALVILAFEAMALVNQLGREALKTESYAFGLIWILAILAAILLLLLRTRAHTPIVLLASLLATACVLPGIGWQALPVASQVSRLERLLTEQGMLSGDTLKPASSEPDAAVREAITDAVEFVAYSQHRDIPAWFVRDLRNGDGFRRVMGFDKAWPMDGNMADGSGNPGVSLVLAPGSLDVSGYRWAVSPAGQIGKGNAAVDVAGERGTYRIRWSDSGMSGIPAVTIELDGKVVLQENMNTFIDTIAGEYPSGRNLPVELPPQQMSVAYETEQIRVLLVFGNVDIQVDPGRDEMNYWMNLQMLYLAEKP